MQICSVCCKDNGGMSTILIHDDSWKDIQLNVCGHCRHKYGDSLQDHTAYRFAYDAEHGFELPKKEKEILNEQDRNFEQK